MKSLISVASLALLLLSATVGSGKVVCFKAAGSTIALLDAAAAAPEVAQSDDYTRTQTNFDRSIRFGSATDLTEQDYLQAAAKDVQDWPLKEQQQLREAFGALHQYVVANHLNLHLPDTIKMIKTSGKTEFGAEGWTRRNLIMLNTGAMPISLHIVAHEVFHVLSRYNPAMRDAIYAVFHFKPCNHIDYRPAMEDKVITNPDCPHLMHYVTAMVNGEKQDLVLMLYAKTGFKEGNTLNDYMEIGLLGLTGDEQHKAPRLQDGKPVIYALNEVPDIFEQVGTNTPYLLHVEEISAEHFAAVIGQKKLKEQHYADAVRKVLQD